MKAFHSHGHLTAVMYHSTQRGNGGFVPSCHCSLPLVFFRVYEVSHIVSNAYTSRPVAAECHFTRQRATLQRRLYHLDIAANPN